MPGLVRTPANPFATRTRPDALAEVKAELRAGVLLGFFVVDGAERALSHVIGMEGRRCVVTGMEGEPLGSFLSFGAASRAGFAASAEALEHGQN